MSEQMGWMASIRCMMSTHLHGEEVRAWAMPARTVYALSVWQHPGCLSSDAASAVLCQHMLLMCSCKQTAF
jgi:hypothetical protein